VIGFLIGATRFDLVFLPQSRALGFAVRAITQGAPMGVSDPEGYPARPSGDGLAVALVIEQRKGE
jgi:hypothetical protein